MGWSVCRCCHFTIWHYQLILACFSHEFRLVFKAFSIEKQKINAFIIAAQILSLLYILLSKFAFSLEPPKIKKCLQKYQFNYNIIDLLIHSYDINKISCYICKESDRKIIRLLFVAIARSDRFNKAISLLLCSYWKEKKNNNKKYKHKNKYTSN